jgi:hypothetical protein
MGADPRIHADDGAVPQQVCYFDIIILCMHSLVTTMYFKLAMDWIDKKS